ncbi:hypothetical protein [Xanthomonas sp. 10-10]|uniref:Secreted protein n=1 Tax=Xanthomonas sp. 10-10 TaxID=3115848 RepID=A0AAU7P537_9XANT
MNKRVGSMSILLTLFRSNVCWAKPNHAFFYCQHSFAIFFQQTIATFAIEVRQVHRAQPAARARSTRPRHSAFKKALLFRCFSQPLQICKPSPPATLRRHAARCGIVRRLSAS